VKIEDCTIYIDEAGDLGDNCGTRWFVLTAAIVDTKDEANIRKCIKAIRSKFNLQSIHFRLIKNFARRSYIVRELAREHFQYINIMFDTTLYDVCKIKFSNNIYHLICKTLLERVSCILKNTGRKGEIILSGRGTSSDNELVDYIENELTPHSNNKIADVFTNVDCKQASSWDMLQLADVCATTMFYSHEINGYGFITPCFAMRLKDNLCKNKDICDTESIIYYDKKMKPQAAYFKGKQICQHK